MFQSRMRACVAAVVVAGVFAMPLISKAAVCDRGACNARITTSIWTGQPQLQCDPIEVETVRIVVAICCPGACTSTQTFHRCANSTESIQFTACGTSHTVSLAGGATWGDAVEGCGDIVYNGAGQ